MWAGDKVGRGQSGPGDKVGRGQSGPGTKWAGDEVGRGQNGPGDKVGLGTKWVRANVSTPQIHSFTTKQKILD